MENKQIPSGTHQRTQIFMNMLNQSEIYLINTALINMIILTSHYKNILIYFEWILLPQLIAKIMSYNYNFEYSIHQLAYHFFWGSRSYTKWLNNFDLFQHVHYANENNNILWFTHWHWNMNIVKPQSSSILLSHVYQRLKIKLYNQLFLI